MSALASSLEVVEDVALRDSRFPGSRAAREQADWLSWLEAKNLRPRTLYDYSWMSDRLLEAFPGKAFEEFTDGDLLYIMKQVPAGSRKPRAAALRSWFKWGILTRRIVQNPCDLLPDFRPEPKKIIRVFTRAEERVLESLPAPDGQLMTVLLEAGLRKSEARLVRSRDFNLDTRELSVRDGAKGGKERVVIISERLAVAVEELRVLQGLDPHDFLWCARYGGKYDHSKPKLERGMHEWWASRIEKTGIPYRKLHTTRHTYATRWRERGLPLDDLSEMLGHESIQTTSDLYVHINVRDIKRRMDDLPEDVD